MFGHFSTIFQKTSEAQLERSKKMSWIVLNMSRTNSKSSFFCESSVLFVFSVFFEVFEICFGELWFLGWMFYFEKFRFSQEFWDLSSRFLMFFSRISSFGENWTSFVWRFCPSVPMHFFGKWGFIGIHEKLRKRGIAVLMAYLLTRSVCCSYHQHCIQHEPGSLYRNMMCVYIPLTVRSECMCY